jgi:hypothetical protein
MENKFRQDCHNVYEELLNNMGIKKITMEDKLDFLRKKMGDTTYNFMMMEIQLADSIGEDTEPIYFRYLKQHGSPFFIKKRKIQIKDNKKYNFKNLLKKTSQLAKHYKKDKKIISKNYEKINFYGVIFYTKGRMYGFTPNSIIIDPQRAFDREICNEWENVKYNEHDGNDGSKPFFTIVSFEQIDNICKKWTEFSNFDFLFYNSNLFSNVLTYYLN